MHKSTFKNWTLGELLLPAVVFVVLAVFTYGIWFGAPHAGFYFNPSDGRVLFVFVPTDPETGLQAGDVLKQVGSVSWETFHSNGWQTFFEGVRPSETVRIVVMRDGQERTINWVLPGFNAREFTERFLNLWPLPYIFWLFGAAIQLFMRPKDTRWKFMLAANYLTALWLIAGSLSPWHLWGSSLLLHALTWLALPAYVGLHWVFPRPFRTVRPGTNWWPMLWWGLAVVCSLVAVGEMLQLWPRWFFYIGLLLTLVISVALLIAHSIKAPDQKPEIRLLRAAAGAALLPLVSLIPSALLGNIPPAGPIVLLALPVLPVAYFYSVYRHRLGGLEVRTNRVLAIYVFLILLTTLLLLITPIIIFLAVPPQAAQAAVFITILIAVATAWGAILFFPTFQRWFEQRILGISLPYEDLQSVYAARIATSPSLPSLERLLCDEILPSLLVRQFVFLRVQHNALKVFLQVGVDGETIPNEQDFDGLLPWLGRYRSPDAAAQPIAWVRLALPLKTADESLGFWLLGRRDPDDLYMQAEIPVLQSLADQTAIALSNIIQAERLSSMYQDDVKRYEQERLRLSHELHDDVLNGMAALLMMDGEALPERFKRGYVRLTERVREITAGLRPPMLNYGLRTALIDLAETLMERNLDTVRIRVELEDSGERYPEEIEKNLFRIIQQAFENALRHGHATNIRLTGRLNPASVELTIEDNGHGFDLGTRLDLEALLAEGHYGLVGMFERAALIGAKLDLQSQPTSGTQITITWKARPPDPNP